MTLEHFFLLIAIGISSGAFGVVSGGASLISFPALLALGYSPIEANVTNSTGLATVGIGSSFAYRKRLREDLPLLINLLIVAAIGGLIGGILLLWSGERVFKAIVPGLLIVAALLVLLQPWLVKRVSKTHEARDRTKVAIVGTFFASIYSGYFGAGVGVVLVGIYGLTLAGSLQRSMALKVAVAWVSNLVCVIFFLMFGPVAFATAGVLATSGLLGGYIGGHAAQRLPDKTLRFIGFAAGISAALYAAFG